MSQHVFANEEAARLDNAAFFLLLTGKNQAEQEQSLVSYIADAERAWRGRLVTAALTENFDAQLEIACRLLMAAINDRYLASFVKPGNRERGKGRLISGHEYAAATREQQEALEKEARHSIVQQGMRAAEICAWVFKNAEARSRGEDPKSVCTKTRAYLFSVVAKSWRAARTEEEALALVKVLGDLSDLMIQGEENRLAKVFEEGLLSVPRSKIASAWATIWHSAPCASELRGGYDGRRELANALRRAWIRLLPHEELGMHMGVTWALHSQGESDPVLTEAAFAAVIAQAALIGQMDAVARSAVTRLKGQGPRWDVDSFDLLNRTVTIFTAAEVDSQREFAISLVKVHLEGWEVPFPGVTLAIETRASAAAGDVKTHRVTWTTRLGALAG